jgi:acyl carrier protein
MGLDSVELVMDFEKAFEIEIPDSIATHMRTPRDVQKFVLEEYARLGRAADAEAVFRKIQELTKRITNIDTEKIGLDSDFVNDLGLD